MATRPAWGRWTRSTSAPFAEHADAAAADASSIDIALNAQSFPHVQGTLFAELAVEVVMDPIDTFLRTNLITAKAVARHMTARRSGTILTLSTAGSRLARRPECSATAPHVLRSRR